MIVQAACINNYTITNKLKIVLDEVMQNVTSQNMWTTHLKLWKSFKTMFSSEPWYFTFTSRSKLNFKCIHLADTSIQSDLKVCISSVFSVMNFSHHPPALKSLQQVSIEAEDWLLHIKTEWRPSHLRVLQNVLWSPTGFKVMMRSVKTV